MKSVFSLNRFFYQKEKLLPCWLAGRLYYQSDALYQLRSQDLYLVFETIGREIQLKEGSFLAVYLVSKDYKNYQAQSWKLLSTPHNAYKEQSFSFKNKASIVKNWNLFLFELRSFFESKGLIFTPTPSLVECPGTEPQLQVFETFFSMGKKTKKLYLPTSPEMHLKKLLCQNWTDIFEIKKCFRNGELSPVHQMELTMLEWYRAFYSLDDLMEELWELLAFLKEKIFCKVRMPKGRSVTMRDLFIQHLNFPLSPHTSRQDLIHLLKEKSLIYDSKDSWEDLFFNLFLNCIESKLDKEIPNIIYNYPPQLRAFARLNDQGWAERFELYWRGFELANAFYEVIDPQDQKNLFEKHLEQRKDNVPYDQELLDLMKQGMPPCSGIAMGLDRLFLALYNKDNLFDLHLFPSK